MLLARIVIRLAHKLPPLPASIRGLLRTAAHLGHAALDALPAPVIAAGWAETSFGGHAVQWFGVEMPRIFPETGGALQDLSTDVHMWLAYAMLPVAAGHVAAGPETDDHNGCRNGVRRHPESRPDHPGPARCGSADLSQRPTHRTIYIAINSQLQL